MNAYLDGMRRYAVFDGRSTRSQYWFFLLFFLIATFCALVADDMAGTNYGTDEDPGLIVLLVSLAHIVPGIAVMTRRLHDIDMSGRWMWIGLVPGVGQVILLILACTSSSTGPNRFGLPVGSPEANPRLRGAVE